MAEPKADTPVVTERLNRTQEVGGSNPSSASAAPMDDSSP